MTKPTKKKPIVRPEYETFTTSLDIQRVQREVRTFEMRQAIGPEFHPNNVRLDSFMDHMTQNMILRMKAQIATKKFESKTVIFPADWWQSLKKRWFPVWALKKWPVQHTQVTFEANAYHPDIAIPDHATYVEVIMRTNRDQ